MTRLRALAAICALTALLANLVCEYLLMPLAAGRTLIPGLLDFLPLWNRGVSFGLLRQDGDMGRQLLSLLLALVVGGVAVLAWRAAGRLMAAGYGLIIGGALGNLLDRVRHGAVFDYLSLHLGAVPLFVFNFADAAISAGVLLLLVDALLAARPQST